MKHPPTVRDATNLPCPAARPGSDIIIYDGNCIFCQGQVSRLARWDTAGRLSYMSLHDEEVYRRWPDLDRDELMRRMYVVTTAGRKLGGVHAIRYLCRKLPSLWWLAPLLHIPFSFPVWNALYSMVANRRYRIAGQIACDEHCQVHR